MPLRHPFGPLWNAESELLILGTFPSVKSRENAFYYGHPQNRFWRVLAAVFREDVPASVAEKTAFLLRHHVALWDVAGRCEIRGSADASLRLLEPNDLSPILEGAGIRDLFANGTTAGRLYRRHLEPVTGRGITVLPSTSPANASWTLPRLVEAWRAILTDREKQA
ncbi:MAG TPA: DNA-deoxyinosine glycosylase [Oscillospiraceae bacterium]|nr:DNA-deoxyinosine glycosylase [Oscillospiraceae bacterium]